MSRRGASLMSEGRQSAASYVPDTSKTYTSVPQIVPEEESVFTKIKHKIDVEMGFDILEPWERKACYFWAISITLWLWYTLATKFGVPAFRYIWESSPPDVLWHYVAYVQSLFAKGQAAKPPPPPPKSSWW